jgi:PIN domain nuclease of toxin-antitoxin system
VFVSLGSVWEIAIKVGLGRWREAALLLANIETELNIAGFELKPIELAHVRLAGLSQSSHRDPFDRLLVAQATLDGLSLVSADRIITTLTPNVLW